MKIKSIVLVALIVLSTNTVYANNLNLIEELPVSFNIGDYKLFKGIEGKAILPLKAVTNLYAVIDGKIKKRIDSMSDLSTILQSIKSSDQALEFIKLFKHHQSYHLFNKLNNKDGEFILNIVDTKKNLSFCSITKSKFEELKLEPVKINEEKDSYIIELNIVRAKSSNTIEILRSIESVDKNGRHNLISRRKIVELSFTEIILPLIY